MFTHVSRASTMRLPVRGASFCRRANPGANFAPRTLCCAKSCSNLVAPFEHRGLLSPARLSSDTTNALSISRSSPSENEAPGPEREHKTRKNHFSINSNKQTNKHDQERLEQSHQHAVSCCKKQKCQQNLTLRWAHFGTTEIWFTCQKAQSRTRQRKTAK